MSLGTSTFQQRSRSAICRSNGGFSRFAYRLLALKVLTGTGAFFPFGAIWTSGYCCLPELAGTQQRQTTKPSSPAISLKIERWNYCARAVAIWNASENASGRETAIARRGLTIWTVELGVSAITKNPNCSSQPNTLMQREISAFSLY